MGSNLNLPTVDRPLKGARSFRSCPARPIDRFGPFGLNSSPVKRCPMPNFKLHISHYVIAITGFAHNQLVRTRNKLKIYDGPTIELTISFPMDPPKRFNVPYPITKPALKRLINSYGGILWPKEIAAVFTAIESFAKYVANNHDWDMPFRPFPMGTLDCVAVLRPVVAKGGVGPVSVGT